MLDLSVDVSSAQCPPVFASRESDKPAERSTPSCACCEIYTAGWGESHQFDGSKKTLCPICHSCLHLDYAGMNKAGTMIWLPELTQVNLNVTCVLIFMTLVSKPSGPVDKAFIERMKLLFKSFELRSQPLVTQFGGKNTLFDASSPLFYAQQLSTLSPALRKDLSIKIDGLRMLPSPEKFMPFIKAIQPQILAKYPMTSWPALLESSKSKFAEEESGKFGYA